MNIVTSGVVLSRKSYGEYGRMITLYTRDLGRISARMAGVDRPQAKLKAFSEPMTYAEYRLYIRPGSSWATVTGGKLVDTHPSLRLDLTRMLGAFEMCELLLRLTPERAPSPAKFDLITGFLAAFAEFPDPGLPVAFGLRLLEQLGLGIQGIGQEDQEFLARLRGAPIGELLVMNADTAQLNRVRGLIYRTAEAYLDRNLNIPRVRSSLEQSLKDMTTLNEDRRMAAGGSFSAPAIPGGINPAGAAA